MSETWPPDRELPVLPSTTCPFCSVDVPDARYCGACGADLLVSGTPGAQRLHSFAAFPDEHVVRLSLVSSLFPHLAHRARAPFRMALTVVLALMVVFSLADTVAPLMAVCALGVPLLFLLYVAEVDPYEGTFITPTLLALVSGSGFGVAWALIGGSFVDRALQPSPTASLSSGQALLAGIVVPVVGQLLICLPILVIRALQRPPYESLDGFVTGATSALGFTLAATLTLLSPWLSGGQLVAQPFLDNLTTAVVRGITFPLVTAMVTGLIGAAFWKHRGVRSSAKGRWLTSPLCALLLAFLLQVGSAFANLAGLSDATLLAVQIGTTVVGVVLLRIGLHHVLLHEAQRETVGPPRVCPHCSHIVPAMAFCPHCGVAERATTRSHRGHRHRTDELHAGTSAAASETAVAPWPTTKPGSRAALSSFPVAPVVAPTMSRLSHRAQLVVLGAGLAVLSGVLVVVAELATPGAPPPCPPLKCQSPPSGETATTSAAEAPVAAPGGEEIRFASGFGIHIYPVAGSSFYPDVAFAPHSITMTYDFTDAFGGTGTLTVSGGPSGGATPSMLAQQQLNSIAPNAQQRYQLPSAYVGYWPGYGVVSTTQVASADGSSVTSELIVVVAVHGGMEATVTAVGRLVPVGPKSELYDGHPSPASINVAYVAGEIVNSITFPGSPVP